MKPVSTMDEEDIQLANSAKFWRLIESRRTGEMIPLAELKERLQKHRLRRTKKGHGTGGD